MRFMRFGKQEASESMGNDFCGIFSVQLRVALLDTILHMLMPNENGDENPFEDVIYTVIKNPFQLVSTS